MVLPILLASGVAATKGAEELITPRSVAHVHPQIHTQKTNMQAGLVTAAPLMQAKTAEFHPAFIDGEKGKISGLHQTHAAALEPTKSPAPVLAATVGPLAIPLIPNAPSPGGPSRPAKGKGLDTAYFPTLDS
jgi:hypothetical protein